MAHPRFLRYGDRATLVELDGSPVALRAALLGWPGIEELVPAARTLLVRFDPNRVDQAALSAAIVAAADDTGDAGPAAGPLVTLAVRYDGPDLDDVAAQVGCSTEEVIRRHCAGEYTVAFCGFAPGFAYLIGLDPRLQLARRPSPRASVPAGAVAVAAEYTAAYPRSSPGGWQLLGRTDAPLWDPDRAEPALLTPGTRVRFEAIK